MSDPLVGPGPVAFRTSQARRPRGVVRINGKGADFLSLDVAQKTYFSADRFTVELEAWGQKQGFGIAFWDKASTVQVECLMGFLSPQQDVGAVPSSLTSLLVGQVDNVDAADLSKGRLKITGRDLTSRLIDTKTSNRWPDQTASQIVTMLATQNGLTPQVTATSTPAGQYYDNAYAQVSRELPVWDLITFFAQQEGYDAYVKGSALYFGPPQSEADGNPYVVNFGCDGQGRRWSTAEPLKLSRSLTMAMDINVTVKSHNVAAGAVVTAVAERKGKGGGQQNYVIRRPNLTQEQANNLAQQYLVDLTKFERLIEGSAEGDVTLAPQTRAIRLAGTGTSWDQIYYPDLITHRFSFEGGYRMDFRAKNHSSESQLAI